jgi:hypothetical protein
MEGRYRYRWVFQSDIPPHLDKNTLQKKQIPTKRGKAWLYRVENDDVFSLVNTLLKMAKKRALVDAALSAGRLSEIFTEDQEYTPADESGGSYDQNIENEKQAVLAEIKQALISMWPGRSDEDQEAKAQLLHEIFNKRRWDQIEHLPLNILEKGKLIIQERAQGL